VRSDSPDGKSGVLVPPAGVAKAGGARARVLIEHLRAEISALEQVPVSLAIPPALEAAPPPLACSLSSPPLPLAGQRPEGLGLEGLGPEGLGPALSSQDPVSLLSRFERSGLHEIKPDAYADSPAALAFALAVIAQCAAAHARPRDLVLWCLTEKAAGEWGRPYGPGLIASGLDPSSLLIVMARNERDAAWALEEGLKSRALIAALAEIEIGTPLMARRLGLAASGAGTPCLMLSSHLQANLPGTVTAWRIAARTSGAAPFDARAPGNSSYQLTLERCRGKAPGQSLIVEFSHESFRFGLSAASPDRTAEAGEENERCRAVGG